MKNINFKSKPLLITTLGSFLIIIVIGCKKMIKIDPPLNSITTNETFENDARATSAVIGIYSKIINTNTFGNDRFGNGSVTIWSGLSSDEMKDYFSSDPEGMQFEENRLLPDNSLLLRFWSPAYSTIYQANACIEGLEASADLTPALKDQLMGEAKFLRSFCYFYLTNLFGDVPLVLSTDWAKTSVMTRTPRDLVYQQIISDLKDAETTLPENYNSFNNERVRATKWAAAAFLSRVYLYKKDYSNAEIEATNVINQSNLFSLLGNLDSVFLKNNREAILQLQPSNVQSPFTITETARLLPLNASSAPRQNYLSDELITSFEANDKRKASWITSSKFSGVTYYYPYKYKVRQGTSGGTINEYYVLFRLAEVYLIRAEARAQHNDISNAIADLNVIRTRAGLPTLLDTLSQSQLLTAIEQERRVELFCEWSHRWFDLTRTNRATSVLSSLKGSNWQVTDQLYPIPESERIKNSKLTQNDGY